MSKVLIAEDEESFRSVFLMFLSGQGHVVRIAGTGQLAIDMGREFEPDVLIADWMLDALSGLDVAATLQAARPTLKVIFITGFSCGELVAAATTRKLSNFRCLEKPFGIEELVDCLRDVLGEASS